MIIGEPIKINKWGSNQFFVNCICNCGNTKLIPCCGFGQKQSCGCAKPDIGKWARKHGMSNSPERGIYKGMIARCYKPTNTYYHRYGGRGIKVCDRWKNSFVNFLEDLGIRPSKAHSLERIDNNADYSPENCKWATLHEQNRNKSTNIYIEHNGERLIIADWAAKLNMPPGVIRHRFKRNMPIEEVLFVGKLSPKRIKNKRT